MRTRESITDDLIGYQNLTLLQGSGGQRSTGLRGISAYQVQRDGATGRVQITTKDGSTYEAVDIGLGVLRSGDRIPSTVSDRGTTWIDY